MGTVQGDAIEARFDGVLGGTGIGRDHVGNVFIAHRVTGR
jgi:hypothetical protein